MAINPNPAVPRMVNIPTVLRIIPNSPYSLFPKICAHRIPDSNTINLAKAVPENVHKAPETNLLAMVDSLKLLMYPSIFRFILM